MLSWDEFAWSSFLYGAIGGDKDYQGLVGQTQLLRNLRLNPAQLNDEEIRTHVIEGFLNRWKCRMHNSQQSARALSKVLQVIQPLIKALGNMKISTVNFNQQINLNNKPINVSQAIEHGYNTLMCMGFNVGPTATSKLLHILQPELFVMWDNAILAHYRKNNQNVGNSGLGYCAFLQMMQKMAVQISQMFQSASLNPPAGVNESPESYLSNQMGYNPPKTLAKYLDEYNWVVITNGVHVPPHWHP